MELIEEVGESSSPSWSFDGGGGRTSAISQDRLARFRRGGRDEKQNKVKTWKGTVKDPVGASSTIWRECCDVGISKRTGVMEETSNNGLDGEWMGI